MSNKNRNNQQNQQKQQDAGNSVFIEKTEEQAQGQEVQQSENQNAGEQQGEVSEKNSNDSSTENLVVTQELVPEAQKVEAKVEEPAPEVDLKADGVQLSAFQTRMAWVDEHGTTHEKYVKAVMTNYVDVGLNSTSLEKIATEQKRLWRLFTYIHAHPGEFTKLFGLVIEFAREYREKLFNLHMFYRAQEGLNLGADELQCFNNIRTLLMNTIESKNRASVKALLDIRKIVDHPLIPENVRGMYVAYYQ